MMKTSPVRSTRPTSSSPTMSPKGRIRKSSEERKEKVKVEATLRRILGSDDDSTQLELVLAAIQYIRELQHQLDCEQENTLPSGFEQLFEKAVRT